MKLSKKERRKQMVDNAMAANPNDSWRARPELQKENADWVTDAIVIANKIINALEDQDLSQRDLAQRLDVTPQAVNKIVKGRQNLTLGSIRKLEAALGISLISIRHSEAHSSIAKTKMVPKVIHYYRTNIVFDGNITAMSNSKNRSNDVSSHLRLSA